MKRLPIICQGLNWYHPWRMKGNPNNFIMFVKAANSKVNTCWPVVTRPTCPEGQRLSKHQIYKNLELCLPTFKEQSDTIRTLGTQFSSLVFQESWVGHHIYIHVSCVERSLPFRRHSAGDPREGRNLWIKIQFWALRDRAGWKWYNNSDSCAGHGFPLRSEPRGCGETRNMPGWWIIYDTAAGNGPHHDTLGIGGFLPHG